MLEELRFPVANDDHALAPGVGRLADGLQGANPFEGLFFLDGLLMALVTGVVGTGCPDVLVDDAQALALRGQAQGRVRVEAEGGLSVGTPRAAWTLLVMGSVVEVGGVFDDQNRGDATAPERHRKQLKPPTPEDA